MRLLLTCSLAVAALTGNGLILSTTMTTRWSCTPDCACLAGGGDDVTRSRDGQLCMRSAEVGQLSASRLASFTGLTVDGRPSRALLAAARQLSNVRRLTITAGKDARVDDWARFFSAFRRLDELTIRNSSSTAAAAAVLSVGVRRLLPNLRRLDVSASGAVDVDLRSLWTLRRLEVLDVSGNSLRQLTTANDSACIDYDKDSVTSVSGLDSTSGLLSPTAKPASERCRQSVEASDRPSSSLRVFNASRNRIDVIDVELFGRKSGRKLEVLDLSFNRLSRLDNGTFMDLYALRCVNLSHNVIADIELDAFAMTSDGQSGSADVGYQATGKQPEKQYYISLASCTQGWRSIQVVDLSYNKLAVLREGLLEQALCAVRQLILSHNQIDRLPRYMLEHLPYLTHLDLSYNALTWLDVGAFTNPSLSVIDLSGNRLRKIVSMTFLYLPALRSVDLARNEISYVYKFAFYRMCSDASRPIAVSLRANRLDVDAVWKLLTTFEHLENDGCRVLVDLRDNSVERFLAPDTLAFVRKRVTAAADDLEDAPSQLQHFRRWTHVTVDLAGNRIHCDCTLATELQTFDTVLEMIGGNGSKTRSDLITTRWRRLNCCEPVEHAGLSVGTFVDSIAPTICRPLEGTQNELTSSYGVCSTSTSQDDDSESTTVNCSDRHLTEFPPVATRASISANMAVRTVDLSKNRLKVINADRLRALYPSLRVILLHDNLITSLPVALVDGSLSLASLTLAGNPLTCDCAQPWLSHDNIVRLSTIVADWHDARCSDGRSLRRFTTVDYRCAGPTGSSGHPGIVWTIAVTLGSVVIIATGLTLTGLIARLVSWVAGRRRRKTKVYDVISVDGGTGSGKRSTMLVLVVYCGADDEWVRSKLMPLLRQSSSSMTDVVRLSLRMIDADCRKTGVRRQFTENSLRRSLAECHLAVVVVSSNLVDEISRRGDASSGFVRDTASRRVYVSAAGDADIRSARRAFGRGAAVVSSDDDAVERIRVEMAASSTTHQHRPLLLPQVLRDHKDADQQLINPEKY